MFTIKSRTWNLIVDHRLDRHPARRAAGGLFGLQGARSGATTTNLFIIGLGVLTFLFFAGPGIAFVLRKRIPFLKKHLPGGSLTWVRAHLYLPILALVAAYVHATSAPFRGTLSSGKVLLGIGIVVSICGVARHHLIGVSKAAVNADAQISKHRLAALAPVPPTGHRLQAAAPAARRHPGRRRSSCRPTSRPRGRRCVETQAKIDHDFPRGGGQSRNVRGLQAAARDPRPADGRAVRRPGFHVVDVLGITDTVTASDKERIASVSDCNGCHSEIVDDWKQSAMAHAQTGTIMEAQLPVTLAKNEELADQLGVRAAGRCTTTRRRCASTATHRSARCSSTTPNAVLPLNETTDAERPAGGQRRRRGGQPGRRQLRGVPHPVGAARRARRGRQDQHRQRHARRLRHRVRPAVRRSQPAAGAGPRHRRDGHGRLLERSDRHVDAPAGRATTSSSTSTATAPRRSPTTTTATTTATT